VNLSPHGEVETVNVHGDNPIKVAVREAVRAGMEAAREAAEAMREAAQAAREAAAEARQQAYEHDGVRSPRFRPWRPLPPMTGGKLVSGTLNGGGTEIYAAAMNGDVVLRKVE
jgi:hypothetical protein